jgi:hypothetical protein
MFKNFSSLVSVFVFLFFFVLFFNMMDNSLEVIRHLPGKVTLSMFLLSALIGILIWEGFKKYHLKELKRMDIMTLENQFKIILANKETLKFNRRVGGLVFFDYIQYMLVYNINQDLFYVMRGEECILTSHELSQTQTIMNLKEFIINKWEREINDCLLVNNILYSKNLFDVNHSALTKVRFEDLGKMNPFIDEDETIEAEQYDVDEILDKINQHGVGSLTKDEIEFLKNQK